MPSIDRPFIAAAAMLAAVVSVTGCANTPISLAPVGPAPTAQVQSTASEGALVVYSATEDYTQGNGPRYFPHSGYTIVSADGKTRQYVPNHLNRLDEQPKRVRLAAGTYTVIARSQWHGQVSVPVVVAPRRVTEVHLDGNSSSHFAAADETSVVRLPNGRVVGWRGEAQRQ
jgi:hypothetical protein